MPALFSKRRAPLALMLFGACGILLLPRHAAPAAAKVGAEGHWAFQPASAPGLPAVKNVRWPRTSVDYFILARLEQQAIQPNPEANRTTLIRRLRLDLLGLPPSPEQVAAFVGDTRADAYERLVEGFLASPHYGERWGQHWLDVAGYADSNGYFDADSDRPHAWRYRDYVVRSFNLDKPFDQFVREQIAGDELVGHPAGGDITPENLEQLIATHFLRNAPDGTGESDGNPLERTVDRYAVLEGNLQIIGAAFLGVTVQCARCHDHKFEPLTQTEYYSLQAILRPAYNLDKWLSPKERNFTIGTEAERMRNRDELDRHDRELKALKESQEGLLKPLRKLLLDEKLQALPKETRNVLTKALEKKEKERTEEMKALLKKHSKLVDFKTEDIEKRFPELAQAIRASETALQKLEKRRPTPLPLVSILSEPGDPVPAHRVLIRGNHAKPGDEAAPAVPAFLKTGEFSIQPQARTSGRRLAFARWLTSPSHPTFGRMAVNRIWQHHFGTGLVSTPDNFGVTGAKPTHPELLDHLASEFVRSGWSTKAIHRLIVNSAAYRQSASTRPELKDPDNHLLWHFPLQRLDAEAVRDSMLAVTGELDRKPGGPYVPKAKTSEGEYIINENEAGAKRRSIYLQQRRTNPVTFLEVFDPAKMNPNCAQRSHSTVALQSLTLLNSSFVRTRSRSLAERLLHEREDVRVKRAFELTLARPPTSEELAGAEEFLEAQRAEYSGKPNMELAVYTDFSQMLLASNGFLYVE